MRNSRTNPTRPVCDWYFFNEHYRRRKPQKPHHPSKVQVMNCFTANPISGMSCEVFAPEKPKTIKGPPPFNGAGKNKGAFAHCHCTCSRFVSLIQPFAVSRGTSDSAHYFISFISPASAPHAQLFRASTTALFPTHRNSIPVYFYQRIVYPIKTHVRRL
jgi:hypothetical protein